MAESRKNHAVEKKKFQDKIGELEAAVRNLQNDKNRLEGEVTRLATKVQAVAKNARESITKITDKGIALVEEDAAKLKKCDDEVKRLRVVGKKITDKGVALLRKEGGEKQKIQDELDKTKQRLRLANNDLLVLGHPTHMTESLRF
jgi:SMC interacting uncharacterized protein involved in chromosome segregation